jgi:hypothetical protein
MRGLALLLPLVLSCSACTIPEVLSDLDRSSPPLELGRPPWVRNTARVGAVTGGLLGGLVSIVVLPITYPLSLLADEPLGVSREQFRFAPVTAFASTGHVLFGGPADAIDWTVRRAWRDDDVPADYEFTPARPPVGPGPAEKPERK